MECKEGARQAELAKEYIGIYPEWNVKDSQRPLKKALFGALEYIQNGM